MELPIPKPRHTDERTMTFYHWEYKPKRLMQISFILDPSGDKEVPDSEREVPKSEYRRLFGEGWREIYPEII